MIHRQLNQGTEGDNDKLFIMDTRELVEGIEPQCEEALRPLVFLQQTERQDRVIVQAIDDLQTGEMSDWRQPW